MEKLTSLFGRGKKFLGKISPSDRLVLMYDTDVDGICAATITLMGLKKLGIKISRTFAGNCYEIGKMLMKMKFDRAIVLDAAIDRVPAKKHVLILDHHPTNDLNSGYVVHINPRLEMLDIYQPATYVAYKFFSSFLDIKGMEWVAVLGTVGDYAYRDCRDVLDSWIRVKSRDGIWRTRFGRASMVLFGVALELGFKKTLNHLISAKNLDDFVKNKKIMNAYRVYDAVYRNAKTKFWKNSEQFKELDLIFSVIQTKYKRIGTPLLTEVSRKNPEKIVVLLETDKNMYKIHVRYQAGGVHMGELMERVCQGIGSGGGHERAAGARINKKKIKTFKKRLITELKRVSVKK